MSIDGTSTVVLGLVAVLLFTAVLALLWDRIRVVGRAGLITLIVLAVAATSALEVNRLTETYPSWSALTGKEPAVPADVPDASDAPSEAPPAPGAGRLVTYQVAGAASGMNMPLAVYLPAAYFTPAGRELNFPVIEALHGYPGTPQSWLKRLDIVGRLDQEMAAGRMAPTVVLLPFQTPNRLLDTECTDMAGGPRAETYVTKDVPEWARTHLRVRTDRSAWGLTGYSAGAFCAMNLLLKHPDKYVAAASLSGYADPGIKVGDQSEKTTNNIAWRMTHVPLPAVSMWVGWASDDKDASAGSRQIVALAKPPLTAVTGVVPRGGHSHAVWRQMEGPAFDWLSAHLARPTPISAGRRGPA
ncbi:alpha/beta hydrolase-fold protein [Paractinoplanes ferrugineus]|uniref:Esterase n=1 Tax=Paractinoplanes ferrugineus TaxID=113564 RepID=A0A919IU66_9ACTN|nr:alpha/beta hydrolase-fold protein [Actinoplanes ferrugineus]GIE09070.1 esterase [Actinoplanes ferrugineus]